MHRTLAAVASLAVLALLPAVAPAANIAHPNPHLAAVYPAGGRQGQAVPVEFVGQGGLDKATGVLIEGPPGITVKDFTAAGSVTARATFVIAPDAPPGVRRVRVVGGANGLTNHRLFHVGRLAEAMEKEPNNEPAAAQEVTIPCVVNGRIDPALDVDCFAFTARAGQRLVAAVLAHGMDSRLMVRGYAGFLDTSLEVLDASGKVVAAAEDTLGLDPVAAFVAPADGRYTVRVHALGYFGARESVYRLTLGEVPYPTSVFPPGGRRGTKLDVTFDGPNVPAGHRQAATPAADNSFAWHTVAFDHPLTDGRELPLAWGDNPELLETEPNDEPAKAAPLTLPVTVNGRFDRAGDADCFRVALKKGQGVLLEVTAQRHLRSPADTLLEVLDAAGKKLAENDDGDLFRGQCEHDFPSADSRLEFTAPADGDYVVRLTEQNGVAGPGAVYRLSATPLVPDFGLYQWPDAVPVWGPGATASFVVETRRWGGHRSDIRLRIDGLPPGWTGSVNVGAAASYYAPNHGIAQKCLMTITAPADAPVGTVVPFRVVGRSEDGGQVLERVAQPQTLYGGCHTDRMHLRHSPQARAAVCPPLDCRLETPVKELTVAPGGTVKVPVKVIRPAGSRGEISVSIDGEAVAAGSAWKTPTLLKPDQTEAELELTVRERRPATYGIVVSRSWASDLRAGRPGPCTPVILLHVREGPKGK